MQKEEFIIIANKVAEGLASDQEKQLFLFHLGTFAKENQEWEKIDADFRQQVEDDIRVNIRDQVFPEIRSKSKFIKLWQRVAGVAAVVALINCGIYFFNNSNNAINNDPQIVSQDVAPGSFGATLTLANGKTIKLSDVSNGELAQEAGVVITKSADGKLEYEIKGSDSDPNKINTLTTAKGETYQLRLPDGSLVWLNAASSLTYSAALNERGIRRVRLEGEGYFEIAKDKAHPFIVFTNNQEIKVLGTHFNINSYKGEPNAKTTLLEGSVSITLLSAVGRDVVSRQRGERNVVLKPNQQAILSASNEITVEQVNAEEAIAWKQGIFMFNSTPLDQVMRQVARWYNIEVIYENPELKTELMGGSVSMYDNVSRILKTLENTGAVKFKIDGRKVTVLK